MIVPGPAYIPLFLQAAVTAGRRPYREIRLKIFKSRNMRRVKKPQRDTCLFDTLQRVPQLLQCVSASVGLRALRLVCKAASSAAVKAITVFRIKLSSDTSLNGHLLQMAAFLQHSRLQHLRLEIGVGPGKS